jgi:hypothetical protein
MNILSVPAAKIKPSGVVDKSCAGAAGFLLFFSLLHKFGALGCRL